MVWMDFCTIFFSSKSLSCDFQLVLRCKFMNSQPILMGPESFQLGSIDYRSVNIFVIDKTTFCSFYDNFFIFFRLHGSHHMSASLLQRQQMTLRADNRHDRPKQALFLSGLVFVAVKNDEMSPSNFSLPEPKSALRNGERPFNTLLHSHCGLWSATRHTRYSREVFFIGENRDGNFFQRARLVGKLLCNSKEEKTWLLACATRNHLNYLQIALLCDNSLEWLEAQPSIGSRTI